MIGDASAGRVVLVFVDVLAQNVPAYFHEHLLRCRKEVLTYAAAYVVPVIIRNLLLIITPYLLFALINHFLSVVVEMPVRAVFECVTEILFHRHSHFFGFGF